MEGEIMEIHIKDSKGKVVLTCDKLPNRFIESHYVLTEAEKKQTIIDIKAIRRRKALYEVIDELIKELGEKYG